MSRGESRTTLLRSRRKSINELEDERFVGFVARDPVVQWAMSCNNRDSEVVHSAGRAK